MPASSTVHLRAGGVSVLLDTTGAGLPRVLHWGADLGEVQVSGVDLAPAVSNSAVEAPVPLGLLPERSHGYRGRPGLSGHRDGRDWSPAFTVTGIEPDGGSVRVTAEDADAGLSVRSDLVLEETGLLRLRHVLRNDGATPYALGELGCVLPLPYHATEILDLTGRWCRERSPQRHPFGGHGSWVRESRHGRTGHDATLLLCAGTPGFGFRTGEVWAVHLGWSGNHVSYAERAADGRAAIGAAELLEPGEVVLGPGAEYATPWAFAAWSGEGLDGVSRAVHGWLRARPEHPRSPRPVILNTWEAVYFDHRLDGLRELADVAAEIGVERFVLDDGWFRHRRDDTAGLGDWYVDEGVWPDGLTPLVAHVRDLGMQFGLWVEPEMVNPDSDLHRAHPDWVLRLPQRMPPPWRHQQVLDLGRPEAYDYVLDRLDALLAADDIAYLKWDHNRDLIEAAHDGRPGVHEQTLAVYRLLDELRSRHPGVEIESCSSGGGRVDLGILARTDRVWASDTNDALERQTIQRWTQLLLPPELVGAHVGPPTAHTTGRTHRLSLRGGTSLFGHLGLEWDVRRTDPDAREVLRRLIATYKQHRALLHSGHVVRADHPDPAALVHGVVAPDGSEGLFAYVQVATSTAEVPAPARLPGLAAARRYRVRAVDPAGAPATMQHAAPGWATTGASVAGSVLSTVGLPVPVLLPEDVLVLHVRAE